MAGNTMTDAERAPRKIVLPNYCNPYTGRNIGRGPEPDCDHDYDPVPKPCDKDPGSGYHWTCTRCGNIRCYEVYN